MLTNHHPTQCIFKSEVFESGIILPLIKFMFNFLHLASLKDYFFSPKYYKENPWRAISSYTKIHADTFQELKMQAKHFNFDSVNQTNGNAHDSAETNNMIQQRGCAFCVRLYNYFSLQYIFRSLNCKNADFFMKQTDY